MVGNKGLEISQETFENLARRYWITAVGIVLAAEIVTLSIKYRGDYMDIGILIGGGIGVIIGRLILAAISGEPESERLGILIGGIIIFGIPTISMYIMFEKIPVLFVGLLGLVIFLSFNVYQEGQKEPEIYFFPLSTALIILVTITTTGLPISAILYSSIIDSLATSFLAGGVIGALLGIILVASARRAGQPGYVVVHLLGVGFAFFGIALGIVIGVMIYISIKGFGFACC